eukprot:CAMPEP_0201490070 /NCGR_PEP_ID=MMETSP0151_2-20130828/24936_1 /ASSEMBLY_ACC=CAM_ASM_000257 /TAXON_ID=200890 /ORGANISM="Paramoeba atlantica, Strain 621/1 / CCAP 1560/9" /LENGTH=386 /DNA_ID=CAMNT_0047875879 /DNA_START=296 /DNA_END=1456 /DNA_ORIENTATION=-
MAMAATYLSGGLILTTILIYTVAVLSIYCFMMLFKVRDKLVEEGHPRELSFENIVGLVLGKYGHFAVLCAVVFTQFGFATAYIIFIATNLNLLYGGDLWAYGLMQIPQLIILCWVRQMKWLSPFALSGIFAIALGVITVCIYCFNTQFDDGIPEGALTRTDLRTFPLAYGVVVYLFEGIGLVIPMESKMKQPQYFPYVMWSVHLTVATAVAAFGIVGYLAFYHCTQGPIILNLPDSGPLVVTTVWALNIALTFTYPIQMVPVFDILEEAVIGNPKAQVQSKWWAKTMSLRALIVLLSAGVGVGIPQFSLFLSLIGGLGSAQLMFIFPPITYLKAFEAEISLRKRIICISLFIFGLVTIVITTTFTLINMVRTFAGDISDDDCSLGN